MAKKLPVSPCDEGQETIVLEVRLRQKDVAVFTVRVCQANADVDATLQPLPMGSPHSLFSTHAQATSTATLPELQRGRYALFWHVLTASTPWHTRAELIVNGTRRFLRRKTDSSKYPVNMGFLLIEVV